MSLPKLTIKYFLNNSPYMFLYSRNFNKKTSKLLLPTKTMYLKALHVRMSSFFYLTQLVDIYAYEMNKLNPGNAASAKSLSLTVVYNFQNLTTNDRLLTFASETACWAKHKSVVELYPNANWLEREVGELFGFVFEGKNDTRNLMLQYGDTSAPFKKSFPTVGLKELYYNACTDLIHQSPLQLQI